MCLDWGGELSLKTKVSVFGRNVARTLVLGLQEEAVRFSCGKRSSWELCKGHLPSVPGERAGPGKQESQAGTLPNRSPKPLCITEQSEPSVRLFSS